MADSGPGSAKSANLRGDGPLGTLIQWICGVGNANSWPEKAVQSDSRDPGRDRPKPKESEAVFRQARLSSI